MLNQTFSALECQFLSEFNKGHKTFEALQKVLGFNEKVMFQVINLLETKYMIKLNRKTNEYEFQPPIEGDIEMWQGDILSPLTVLKIGNKKLIGRGKWYEVEPDYDIRRIIWNGVIPDGSGSTLINLIEQSILKQKKTRIVQMEEYKQFAGKAIPEYFKIDNYTIRVTLNTVGEELVDVSLVFQIMLGNENDVAIPWRGMSVRSEISTKELLDILALPQAERNYVEDLKINRMYNFSDFIFSKNEIPIHITDDSITYVKLTQVTKGFELTYYELKLQYGTPKKIDVKSFDTVIDGINCVRELFDGLAKPMLTKLGFNIDMDE